MVEQDYIIRIIHEAVRTLLKLIFNVDQKPEEMQVENEETLEQNNFSRDEIKDGLLKAIKMYGYDNLAETLLS